MDLHYFLKQIHSLDSLKIFLFEDDENDQNGQNDLVMKMSSVKTIVEECIISFF